MGGEGEGGWRCLVRVGGWGERGERGERYMYGERKRDELRWDEWGNSV